MSDSAKPKSFPPLQCEMIRYLTAWQAAKACQKTAGTMLVEMKNAVHCWWREDGVEHAGDMGVAFKRACDASRHADDVARLSGRATFDMARKRPEFLTDLFARCAAEKAIASREAYFDEFGEGPDEKSIGDWDSAAWGDDIQTILNELGTEFNEIPESLYTMALAAWRQVFFEPQ